MPDIPVKRLFTLERMAAAITDTGRIYFDPARPDCFYKPDATTKRATAVA
jgi:hypothetical protein